MHFLVMMLEAYYFADSTSLNQELGTNLSDFEGDVETIRHPKNRLKKLHRSFDEVKDGGRIIARLDLEHVLSDPSACASLRTIFAWCCKALEQEPGERFQLAEGNLHGITRPQLERLDEYFMARSGSPS